MNYELNKNSVVLEIGNHNTDWASMVLVRCEPNLFIFEPNKEKYASALQIENISDKVVCENIGYVDSKFESDGMKYEDINKFFKEFKIDFVDLIKIDLNGYENRFIKRLFDKKHISKINHMMITFYQPESEETDKVKKKLQETHVKTWDDDTFEVWSNKEEY